MRDAFKESDIIRWASALGEYTEGLKFGDQERAVLRLFYDERLKVRKKKVPKFFLYASICEGKLEASWKTMMLSVDLALLNLDSLGYVKKTGETAPEHVGTGGEIFELTADGLEELQSWHPDITLRLKAWIAVMPPWLVLVGSVAGGIGALWKITELVIELVKKLS